MSRIVVEDRTLEALLAEHESLNAWRQFGKALRRLDPERYSELETSLANEVAELVKRKGWP